MRTGPWVHYGSDGTLLFEGIYQNDRLVGRATSYFDSGELRYEGTFDYGRLSGPWTEYYQNGQIRMTGDAYGSAFGDNNIASPLRTGLWLFFNPDGSLGDARFYVNNVEQGSVTIATDPDTDLDRVVVNHPDGSRTVYDVDKEGVVGSRHDALPFDLEEVVDFEVDPDSGEIRIVRKDAEGNLVTSTGRKYTDEEGNVHIEEVDEHGNERETVISPNGSTMIVKTSADGSQSIVNLDPIDGMYHFETFPDGTSVRTSRDPWTGSVVTETFDADGNLVATSTRRPDGWIEEVDRYGNVRTSFTDDEGRTAVIELDRNGNVTTTITDDSGEVVHREQTLAAPREPGREYYETVLGGTEWDELPQSMKTQFAATEREIQDMERRQIEREALEAQRRREEAEREREDVAAIEETELKLAALRAEQEEADRRAAERQELEERRRALEESRERARELQRQYDEAVARGDMDEARRIMALQDEHHDASMELLLPTEAELQEMERLSEIRHRLAQEINQGARTRAQLDIFDAERTQDIKDSVTGWTQWVSVGSDMQQKTSQTTRMAERERAWARAQIEQIDSMLEKGGWSEEERTILLQRREMAELQQSGANELLAANGRITAAGYIIDGALTVTGAAAVSAAGRAGTQLVSGVARRLGSEGVATAAEVAAARVGAIAAVDVSTPAIGMMGSAARRVVGDTAVDAVSAAAGRVTGVARTDVGDLTARLADTVRLTPKQSLTAAGESLAGVGGRSTTSAAYRSPAERASTMLDNAPSLDAAARTERIKRVSEMTPAERQLYNDRLAAEQVGQGWRRADFPDFGDDIVMPPGPGSVVDRRPFTADEVRRLHETGRNLSRDEIIRKAELYRARYEAERLAREATTEAERLAHADQLRQLAQVIGEHGPTVIMPAPGSARVASPHTGAPTAVPPAFAEMPTIIERPMSRFAASREGTEILTAVDFPPHTGSAAPLPAALTPPPPPPPAIPPLRPGAAPTRPVIEWPVGPYIHGMPGPGVGMHHLEAAQRVATETGVPIVIFGSRQTGIRHSTGGPFRPTSDLDIGIVGPPESLVRVMHQGVEARIPNVEHGPMGRFESIEEALRRGYVVVSPVQ